MRGIAEEKEIKRGGVAAGGCPGAPHCLRWTMVCTGCQRVFPIPRHWHYSNSKLGRDWRGYGDKLVVCLSHGPRDIKTVQTNIEVRYGNLKLIPLWGQW